MNNLIEQYELVKETQFIFYNIDTKIIGRIYKIIKGPNAPYQWTISHYCRKEGEFDVYIPSAPFGQTFEEALKSITINPAKLLGIDQRVGSIETGKDADMVM